MQRLVYSPRAYVFIKDQTGHIHNLTGYVTSGNVVRRVDAVSSATVTLRNPDMMFTNHLDEDGNPTGSVFHPMDPITIWLRRVRGRPVRVFTGFLDTTDFLHLYPGTVSLSASCTLKRLLHVYFDPSLPYTMSFLEQYGWLTTGDGEWFSNNALNEFKPDAKDKANQKAGVDGSISQLLFATLKHIGLWDPDSIYIEPLPDDIFTRLNDLAQEFEADNEEAKKEYTELLKRIVGEGSFGNANSDVDVSGVNGDVPQQVFEVGVKMGVNPDSKLMLSAFETGLVEAPISEGKSFGNPSGGDLTGVPGAPASRKSAGWRQETEGAYPGVDRTNVPEAAKRYFNEGNAIIAGRAMGKAGMGAYQDSWTAGNLAQAIQGSAYPDKYDAVRSTALSLLRAVRDKSDVSTDGTAKPESASPGQGTDPQRVIDTRNNNATSSSTTRLDAIVAEANRMSKLVTDNHLPYSNARPPSDTQGYDCSSSVGKLLKAAGYKIDGWPATNTIKQYMKKGVDPSGRVTFWNSDKSNSAGNSVHIWAEINGRPFTTADHLSGHWKDDYYAKDNPQANGFEPFHVTGLDEPATVPKDADTSSGGDATTDPSSPTVGGGAAALFASLDIGSMYDAVAASMLSGEKSLMNDKPLMPFVQQMTNASLRHFQSLPDGKFYAFYPDYFGEMFHHPPYWEVDDIEILNGKVQLSDDALVTHMYVVGDSLGPFGSDRPVSLRSVFSSGVVTIFNAFMADSVLNRSADRTAEKTKAAKKFADSDATTNRKEDPSGMNILLDRDEAAGFLERYGARPKVEDMPMIKSPYFEMFLAYQQFMQAWSRQFLTPFQFTFMPELFPGGKVGFPDHGLQMYIEEVTHSWDYESGFMTEASMSSPSVYGANNKLLPPNMVQAIIEPAKPEKTVQRQQTEKKRK